MTAGALPVWPHAVAPFHAGERHLQDQFGAAPRMAEIGRRVIRAEMPAQHRSFYAALPFVLLGATDGGGQPWATLLHGDPGFLHSPAPDRLQVADRPRTDDPLHGALAVGRPVGLLGLDPSTRRRNRVNGPIVDDDGERWTLAVGQSFGNCPQYIQRRAPLADPAAASVPERPPAVDSDRLEGAAASLLAATDTFFIATHADTGDAAGGSDVSHRGGRPGFVRIDDGGRRLAWPEFAGNRFYNTLGNLLLQPRAGLLVVDFAAGALLHVAGRARLRPPPARPGAAPDGAEWIVDFAVERVRLRPQAHPLRWHALDAAPEALGTGIWPALALAEA